MPEGTLSIKTSDRTIDLRVAIAETSAHRSKGLMGVKTLGPREGMVFLYDSPTDSGFWMKNTLIPLDLAFWDERGRIVDIARMQPCRTMKCPLYHSKVDYVGALEVNGGAIEELGIAIGDTVQLRRS